MKRERAAAYVTFLEALTAARLPELSAYLAPQARFVDPFNDVTGREAVIRVFTKIFEDLTEVDFAGRDLACSEGACSEGACSEGACFFAWTLRGRLRGSGRAITFEGVTELRLDDQGRIAAHIDHWDAASQLYARMPVLGSLLAVLRRRLGAKGE